LIALTPPSPRPTLTMAIAFGPFEGAGIFAKFARNNRAEIGLPAETR
jgi:hypothetical protein